MWSMSKKRSRDKHSPVKLVHNSHISYLHSLFVWGRLFVCLKYTFAYFAQICKAGTMHNLFVLSSWIGGWVIQLLQGRQDLQGYSCWENQPRKSEFPEVSTFKARNWKYFYLRKLKSVHPMVAWVQFKWKQIQTDCRMQHLYKAETFTLHPLCSNGALVRHIHNKDET